MTTFSIHRMDPPDLPTAFEISRAAFASDTHTLMKVHEKGGNDVGDELEPIESLQAVMDLGERVIMIKAVDGEGKMIGWSCWVQYGMNEPLNVDADTLPEPDLNFSIPPADPSLTPLQQLNHLTSTHLFTCQDLLCTPGRRVIYGRGISVLPTSQSKGVGRAMIRYATNLADEKQASMWVHLSNDPRAQAAFEKEGFVVGSRNEVDLDNYARREMPQGREKWGKYEFRLMVWQAKVK